MYVRDFTQLGSFGVEGGNLPYSKKSEKDSLDTENDEIILPLKGISRGAQPLWSRFSILHLLLAFLAHRRCSILPSAHPRHYLWPQTEGKSACVNKSVLSQARKLK